jgi:hypothetical protein
MNYINCYKPFWLFSVITGIVVEIFALVLYCNKNIINSAVCAVVGGCIVVMFMLSWCIFTVGTRIHREIPYSENEHSVTTYTIDISQTSIISESASSTIPAIIV